MRFFPPADENAVSFSGALPVEFASFRLPFGAAHRTTGDFGTVITQEIQGGDFTIWKHDFLIARPVLLHPYVPEGIHTLNYMLKGNIPCELVDFGKFDLQECTYNLYFVPPAKQYAWLSAGHFTCIHIDLNPTYLTELAAEFPLLREFLQYSARGRAKIIRAAHYPIDSNIRMLLKDIIEFPDTGAARNIYIRSRIYDLLLIFSRDLARETQDPFQVDKALLEEVKEYLSDNFQAPLRIIDLARRFGVNQVTLRTLFKQHFGTSIHQFLIELRMKHAVRLIGRTIPIKDVAAQSGYPDVSSFTRAFTGYYKTTPSLYRAENQQQTGEPDESG